MPVKAMSRTEERYRNEQREPYRAVRPRRHLVRRMLGDRGVPRIVSASRGFGKTTLVREYARQVFAGIGVVYLDGSDPALLCSLDDATFPVLPSTFEGPLRLLVIDDLPFLDEARRGVLSDGVDSLLSKGVEVICTVTPSNDVLSTVRRDAITLSARDLFVSEREFEEERLRGRLTEGEVSGSAREGKEAPSAARRVSPQVFSVHDDKASSEDAFSVRMWGIPSLIWGDNSYAAARCIEAFFEENLPREFTDAALAMILLQEGSYRDLEELGVMPAPEVMDMLERRYPLFGIDSRRNLFSAIPLMPDDLRRVHLEVPHEWVVAGGTIGHIIRRLVAGGRWEHALILTDRHLPHEGIEAFLQGCGRHLIDAGFSADVRLLCERIAEDEEHAFSWTYALYLWALCLSGDTDAACRAYLAAAERGLLEVPVWLVAALFALPDAVSGFGHLGDGSPIVLEESSKTAGCTCGYECLDERGKGGCEGCGREHPSGRGHCISTMLMMEHVRNHLLPDAHAEMRDRRGLVHEVLRRTASYHEEPLWRLAFHVALLDLMEQGATGCEDLFEMSAALERRRDTKPTQSLSEALLIKDHMLHIPPSEKGRAERLRESTADSILETLGTSLDARIREDMGNAQELPISRMLLMPTSGEKEEHDPGMLEDETCAETPAVEMPSGERGLQDRNLYIRMFGGFQVSRDGAPLESRLLDKRQVRQMIAYLALNKGREVPRERIFMEMWPRSNSERARNSFYIVWGHTRRALGLDEPGRQYIVVRESTLAINPQLVDCDIYRFEELHRKLICLPSDSEGLVESFVELERLYKGDLLTCEFSGDYFDMQRDWYREMFVDSMVGASERAADDGDVKVALWFARKAFEYGFQREDAYCALMRALILNNQKTTAIRTFNTCRDYLAAELDATPSQRTVELYRKARDDTRPSTLVI